MRLVRFRVWNFRSINDSGPVDVSQRTALVGRNESGKSNLLLALASFRPPKGMAALLRVKDFPRDRPRSKFSDDLEVVETEWSLNDDEFNELREIFPRSAPVTSIRVSRHYEGEKYYIRFVGLPPLVVDRETAGSRLTALRASLRSSTRNKPLSVQHLVRLAPRGGTLRLLGAKGATRPTPRTASCRERTSAPLNLLTGGRYLGRHLGHRGASS